MITTERDINKTFSALRQLPLEFDFARIEQFVQHQPSVPLPADGVLKWLSNKNLLSYITILTVLTVLVLMINLKEKSATITGFQPKLSTYENVSVKKKPVAKPARNSPEKHFSATPAPGNRVENPVIFTDVKKESLVIQSPHKIQSPESKSNTISSSFPDSTDDKKLSDRSRKKVITMSSPFCSFGDDDVWIKAFVTEMKKDKIISDTADLRFTLTSEMFKVNGKDQDEPIILKYTSLYNQLSKQLLTANSRISLSVSGSSCSLSKTIDN